MKEKLKQQTLVSFWSLLPPSPQGQSPLEDICQVLEGWDYREKGRGTPVS